MKRVRGGLLFQWHITERCNYRCAHCYQESYEKKDLPLKEMSQILKQFKDLDTLWNRTNSNEPPLRPHITVTGGEPFIREDAIEILEWIVAAGFTFSVLTNGSLVDKKIASKLKRLGPTFVQMSMEGREETHDSIRGKGSFQKVADSVRILRGEGIRTYLSFTAHKDNYKEFYDVAKIGKSLKVSKVWADRFIPWGSGNSLRDKMLSKEETKEFFQIMNTSRETIEKSFWNKTTIGMNRSLQFLAGGGIPYHCTAGNTLLAVDGNGDVYPCRRMPIVIGNLLQTPIKELYYNSSILQELRNPKETLNCQGCIHFIFCKGGLKCLSYAVTGSFLTKDLGCYV